jgi:hypothetical protein
VALLLWMTMIVMKTRIVNTASLVCAYQWLAFNLCIPTTSIQEEYPQVWVRAPRRGLKRGIMVPHERASSSNGAIGSYIGKPSNRRSKSWSHSLAMEQTRKALWSTCGLLKSSLSHLLAKEKALWVLVVCSRVAWDLLFNEKKKSIQCESNRLKDKNRSTWSEKSSFL